LGTGFVERVCSQVKRRINQNLTLKGEFPFSGGQEAGGRGQIASGTVTPDGHPFGVDAKGTRVSVHMFDHRINWVQCGGKWLFRSLGVINGYNFAPGFFAKEPIHGLIRNDCQQYKPAAV